MNGHTRSEKHKMLHYHFHEKKGKETIHELPIQNVPTALVKMLTENSRKNISCPHGLAILEEASPDYQSIKQVKQTYCWQEPHQLYQNSYMFLGQFSTSMLKQYVKEDQLTYLVSLFDGTGAHYITPQKNSHIYTLNLSIIFPILK